MCASDPFVDRSLYDPSLSSRNSSSNSRSSSRARPEATTGRNPWSPLSSEHGDSPPPSTTAATRPGLPTSTSDLSRQISAALSEDLPPPSQESSPNQNQNGNGFTGMMNQNGRKRSESGATLKARGGSSQGGKGTSSPSFLSQFRSGESLFLFSPLYVKLTFVRE